MQEIQLDTEEAKINTIAEDEIFIQVNDTINYWISNYGRMVNNLRSNYYLHKAGNVHYTITTYDCDGTKGTKDCSPRELVAEHFLERVKYKNRIYNIDGDRGNNYYKNLIYVDDKEFYDLNVGVVTIEDLGRKQDYIPFINSVKRRAYSVYNGIYKRCYDSEFKKMYPHYAESTMYEGWKNDTATFREWFEHNNYDVDGELMVVDKDLLFPGNKEYHPNKCCILPQTLNVMLSNCKKHYYREDDSVLSKKNNNLPLGVRYNEARDKYYSQIKVDDSLVTLGYWDTKEEAFADYKRHKEAYILIMADRYKDKIPKYIYEALLKVRVEPY